MDQVFSQTFEADLRYHRRAVKLSRLLICTCTHQLEHAVFPCVLFTNFLVVSFLFLTDLRYCLKATPSFIASLHCLPNYVAGEYKCKDLNLHL